MDDELEAISPVSENITSGEAISPVSENIAIEKDENRVVISNITQTQLSQTAEESPVTEKNISPPKWRENLTGIAAIPAEFQDVNREGVADRPFVDSSQISPSESSESVGLHSRIAPLAGVDGLSIPPPAVPTGIAAGIGRGIVNFDKGAVLTIGAVVCGSLAIGLIPFTITEAALIEFSKDGSKKERLGFVLSAPLWGCAKCVRGIKEMVKPKEVGRESVSDVLLDVQSKSDSYFQQAYRLILYNQNLVHNDRDKILAEFKAGITNLEMISLVDLEDELEGLNELADVNVDEESRVRMMEYIKEEIVTRKRKPAV